MQMMMTTNLHSTQPLWSKWFGFSFTRRSKNASYMYTCNEYMYTYTVHIYEYTMRTHVSSYFIWVEIYNGDIVDADDDIIIQLLFWWMFVHCQMAMGRVMYIPAISCIYHRAPHAGERFMYSYAELCRAMCVCMGANLGHIRGWM